MNKILLILYFVFHVTKFLNSSDVGSMDDSITKLCSTLAAKPDSAVNLIDRFQKSINEHQQQMQQRFPNTYTLSHTRSTFTNQLYMKRKKRYSINNDRNNFKNSYMTIQMNPFSNLDDIKRIRNGTTILLEDDEELMKSEISLKFYENNAIELRLEQDFDSDNDINDN
ncbi:unnamed protein product [Rotaria sordida]|uniref:Uncharacterized protein n=1 Tax=Rotaria sordida TaxID=392033 RepID=A0A815BCT5_9BILA|nr:unnamed protein product [Rotaria sordida]